VIKKINLTIQNLLTKGKIKALNNSDFYVRRSTGIKTRKTLGKAPFKKIRQDFLKQNALPVESTH